MSKARALRMTIVLVGPPGYFWRQGPMREAMGDVDLQVMRMRFCHFGLMCDRANTLPSGSYLHVETTCSRIPTNLWRCTCNMAGQPARPIEHVLDEYGQGAQKAEWRNETLAIMTARLFDEMDLHKTEITQVLYILVSTLE
eukprot:1321711-Pyramimonas_sp.AAC.1